MNMRQYLRLLLCSSVLFALIFSACRNEPKLPVNNWDKTVNVRISGDPESLGYLYVTDDKSLMIIRQIFLPFTDFDPETYKMTPVLAKTLPVITEVTEGEYAGLVACAYEIREEAVWADGSPVTGKDYLFTLKSVYNPNKNSIYASQFRRIKAVVIDEANPKKFVIYSDPYMAVREYYSNFAPLPAYLYDPEGVMEKYSLADLRDKEKLLGEGDLKALSDAFNSPKYLRSPEMLKGSGPYELSEWTTGQQITLTKKANWWGEELSKKERLLKAIPNKVVYKMIPDLNAAVSLMRNGEVDIVTQMDWTTFLNQKKKEDFAKEFNFYTPDKYGYRMMNFNTTKEKLSDPKVRRAIAHLFNREEVFNTVYYGYPTAISGPVYPTKSSYNKDLKLLDFNIDKAKVLLKEAGWEDTDGNGIVDKVIDGELTDLNINLKFGAGNEDYASVAAIFKANAIQAGVNINTNPMEASSFMSSLKSKDFDMTFSGNSDYPFNMDPANKWHTRGGSNHASFGTAESDALIIKIRQTIDVAEQDKLLKELQSIIYENQPGIFICVDKDRTIAHKKFGKIAAMGLSPGFFVNEMNGNAVVEITSSNN